jgi:TonB family protein
MGALLLLLGSLAGLVRAASATVTQDDLNALQNSLKTQISQGSAANSTAGADFRGRTASQDIADWVTQSATQKRLEELLGEQDDSARRAAREILVDQMRRVILINDYWTTWPNLKRERDLWDQWAQLVLPQSSATDSIQRVRDREAEFAKTYVPSADPAVLDADLNSLLRLYNHERLSLSKDANAKWVTIPGRLEGRSRQTPCPTPSTSDTTDNRPNRQVAVTASPNVSDYYPAEARRSGSTGRVLVRLRVDETGCAQRFDVIESTGDPLLDHGALLVAEQMTFKPATAGGKPVASSPTLPVTFDLKDQ